MASITIWTRIEPDIAPTEMTDGDAEISQLLAIGQQAQIHDPLWLLGRQWQMGEFQGEDGGSPIQAQVHVEGAPVTRYAPSVPAIGQRLAGQNYADDPAPGPPLRWQPPAVPLDLLTEREAVRRTGPGLRLAAEAGLHLWRLLSDAGLGRLRAAFAAAFPLAAAPAGDDDSAAFGRIAGRAPDGAALYQRLRALNPGAGTPPAVLPDRPPLAPADQAAVGDVLRAWLDGYEGLFSEPPDGVSAWSSERMERRFAVAAPALPSVGAEAVLIAPEGRGALDWCSFDLLDPQRGTSLGATGAGQATVVSAIPVPVRYPGMPASRFWEIEDARVDLGAIDAADPARLLLVEFALVYGNDWFVVPLELPTGALYRLTGVEVTDTFGVVRTLTAADEGAAAARSRLFRLSIPGTDTTRDLLFLPPTAGATQNGTSVEQVRFVRDEGANATWAIERVIESPIGRPLDLGRQPPAPVPPVGADSPAIQWRLFSELPSYWLPLVPDPDPQHLTLGSIVRAAGVAPATPRGQLVPPDLSLAVEEVGRDGLSVTRGYRLARWVDGSALLWCGRRRDPGTGEASSALTYDYLSAEPGGAQ